MYDSSRYFVLIDVAIVTMQKKPVNSLCSDHLQELATAFEGLAGNKKYKAAILTSVSSRFTSSQNYVQSLRDCVAIH